MNVQHSPQAGVAARTQKIQFSTRLDWLEKTTGILTANDVKDALHIATPQTFGGPGRDWSPEHLLISAVSGCFMTTYLYFAARQQLEVTHLTCLATGQVELENGKYIFTGIDLYPKIYVHNEGLIEQAQLLLQKTKAHCLVSNSLRTPVTYHSEVSKDPHPGS
ncbi:MAG TPA: OsmC family protein [Chitinophaga sp.]|uniref:OsmC family protein n=1 Tax=Chitinophaga sp. TaxID=1869181 RepID=UPI002DB6FEA0|nr:OsmC family protein [Chitinophaga sp.]HEU4556169.1 OsmC family protein [Chitinophaga sp.]